MNVTISLETFMSLIDQRINYFIQKQRYDEDFWNYARDIIEEVASLGDKVLDPFLMVDNIAYNSSVYEVDDLIREGVLSEGQTLADLPENTPYIIAGKYAIDFIYLGN